MKELTKEKAVELHRVLWGYIVDRIGNISKYDIESPARFAEIKKDVLSDILRCKDLFRDVTPEEYGFLDSDGEVIVRNACFLCEYSTRQVASCEKVCPLYDPKGDNADNCLNGLYRLLLEAYYEQKFKDAKNLAIKIRDLPVVN